MNTMFLSLSERMFNAWHPCGSRTIFIEENDETFELIVVEVKIENKEIRIMTGYGPQESWDQHEIMPFFNAIEEEIAAAELLKKSIIIAIDANSK